MTRGKCEDATESDPMQTASSPSSDANSSDFDHSEAAELGRQVRLAKPPKKAPSDSASAGPSVAPQRVPDVRFRLVVAVYVSSMGLRGLYSFAQ